ncbi:MAG TPA: plastocyanin/azurin family copper-binding protein [Gemmatimonadales bacterium]|nr:plastocyanin/azurin family copper-binding protein [Gemmatimonadales bacterium]
MRTLSLILAAGLATACGGSSPTGTGGGGKPSGGTPGPSISATDYAFSPTSMTVQAGATVTWTNDGAVAHTATSDAADSLTWDSGSLAGSAPDPYGGRSPGGSYSVTFTKPGMYPYHCAFHGTTHGMAGTITVTP